jgi:dipeptidyl aminopeptidase/acylaminoacyl peptidase
MKRSALALVALLLVVTLARAQPYTIQQYLNIRSATAPTFAPDGKRIAYLTNVSGTSQVWITNVSGGTPKQLTNYDDNVSFVRWLADDSGIIFGKARGGDENTQFFWMKTDGTGVRELTSNPKVRHNFAEVSPDGKTIYYASNKRNRQYFDIYSMEVASGKETLLYEFDGNADVAAVNDSGTKIVISRDGVDKSLDNNLYLIDLRTKTEVHLTPHTDASEFGNVNFLADGLLFTTNDKRNFEGLAQMRKINAAGDDWSEKNRETKIVHEAAWDVSAVEMKPFGSVVAYTVNRAGFSEIWLRKIETGGKPLIATVAKTAERIDSLPARGIVSALTFSEDQSKLAFSFSSARKNGDIWVYDLKTRALKQLTRSDRAGISEESFIEPELVNFKSFDGLDVSAWYYKPAGVVATTVAKPLNTQIPKAVLSSALAPKSEEDDELFVQVREKGRQQISFNRTAVFVDGYPVIVSVHGGPEGQERPGFNPLYQYYLSRGYAILAPNVRGSTGYGKVYTHLDDVKKREDSVKDLASAVEWLKTNGKADPKRIAVMGGSYGGYMTLAAITLYPDLWAAAVDTVGIVNWETFLNNTSSYRRRQREVEYGMLDRDIEFLRAISPIKKIDRIKAPLFVIHGKNDPRVPYTEAEQLVKALKDRGATVEYKLFDDEGHGISKLKNRLELYPLVADFLDKHLR